MSNNNNNNNKRRPGIDALLQSRGKALKIGQEVRFRLIKGPTGVRTADPINATAPIEDFPVIAKFAESVVKPDFSVFKRFYQTGIPSQKDDSDEEAERLAAGPVRKKRRYRRKEGPRRQWMLQTEEDFLLTMIAQREQGKQYKQDSNVVSLRYEGLPEHSASSYVVMSATPGDGNDDATPQLSVSTLPVPYAIQAFSQPAKVQTMSMNQAEQAIEDQRKNTTRYMMHKNPSAAAATTKTTSKDRLFDKLKKLSKKGTADGDEDGDDVMGDVKFSNRKGTGGARKELLSSMADGVAVDADGVMGGGNDAEFGGKRRFMKMNIQDAASNNNAAKGGAGAAKASNDGMAMADDFYQRDVKAEYEELDYDANEQFDDDDVDLGEGEMNLDVGFADDLDDDEGDDDEEDDDEDEEKKAGLASIKGLKDMLKKARGETPMEAGGGADNKKEEEETGAGRPSSPSSNNNTGNGNNNNDAMETGDDDNKLASVMAAAERKTRAAAEQNKAAAPPQQQPHMQGGERVLTMEGVRYEIFLNNKSIAMKKLMKLYNIKKKSAQDRIKKFQAIIKELCTMEKDPVQGNILKLKQHYQKGI